jgi:hypothetical protein
MKRLLVGAFVFAWFPALSTGALPTTSAYWRLTFADEFKGRQPGEPEECYSIPALCIGEYQSGLFECRSQQNLKHLNKCTWTVLHENNWMGPTANAFVPEEVTVDPSRDDGVLILSARGAPAPKYDCQWDGNKMNCPFLSGALYSKKFDSYIRGGNPVKRDRGFVQKFGRFEVRAKLPHGPGAWPAHWLLPQSGGWPEAGEIDVLEAGEKGNVAFQTYHTGYCDRAAQPFGDCAAQRGVRIHTGKGVLAYPKALRSNDQASDFFTGRFHTYAVEWDATTVRFLVDDVVMGTLKAGDLTYGRLTDFGHRPAGKFFPINIPDRDFFTILNHTINPDGVKNQDPRTFARQEHVIDFVRIYARCEKPEDYCPRGGTFVPNGSGGTCRQRALEYQSPCQQKPYAEPGQTFKTCSDACPIGAVWFTGQSCQLGTVPQPPQPSGKLGEAFLWTDAQKNQLLDYTPLLPVVTPGLAAVACPVGQWDLANCVMGTAVPGFKYRAYPAKPAKATDFEYASACRPWDERANDNAFWQRIWGKIRKAGRDVASFVREKLTPVLNDLRQAWKRVADFVKRTWESVKHVLEKNEKCQNEHVKPLAQNAAREVYDSTVQRSAGFWQLVRPALQSLGDGERKAAVDPAWLGFVTEVESGAASARHAGIERVRGWFLKNDHKREAEAHFAAIFDAKLTELRSALAQAYANGMAR